MSQTIYRFVAGFFIVAGLSFLVFKNYSKSSPPPDQQTSGANVSLGKSIYDVRCATCHGADGKGNGYAAAFVNPRPRNFTEGKFKFRSTETGTLPTDADPRKNNQERIARNLDARLGSVFERRFARVSH